MTWVAAAASLLAVLTTAVLAQTDVLELQGVPDASVSSRQLLQSSDAVGGYYGTPGRGLIQVGGYGGYGRNLIQRGGYGYGRRLVEEDDVILEPSDPLLEYAEQRQAQADSAQMAAQQAAGGVSAAEVAALANAHASNSRQHKHRHVTLPAGTCYCRYDLDFHTWALAEDTCKDALYTRCQSEQQLPCTWLDKFYTPANAPGHILPHEVDIQVFLHEDCSPQPPCSCAGVTFDGTDAVPAAVACCRDLRVACKTPFSGVDCRQVESFCSDDEPTLVLAAWAAHVLHHADCSSYTGSPFHLVSLQALQAAAASRERPVTASEQPTVAEALLLRDLIHDISRQQPPHALTSAAATADGASNSGGMHGRRLVMALAAVAAGAVCVAIVAVVFALQREEGAEPITSPAAPPMSVEEVYKALVHKKAALAAPVPAACVDNGASCSLLESLMPLRRDSSGDSCLSRVISFGRLSSQGSGLHEPLLQQHHLGRSVSNGSEASSTVSLSGDKLL